MVTLSQIEQRIAHLQKKADDLRRQKSASVISSIQKMMSDHGLSIQDIEAAQEESPRKRGRPVGSKNGAAAKVIKASDRKVSPKYRDPVTGATWSGRARPPAWIKDVKDRSKFLIENSTEPEVLASSKRKRS